MKSNREAAKDIVADHRSYTCSTMEGLENRITAALDAAVKQTWEDAADIAQKDLFAEHTERLAQRFRIKASQVGKERGGVSVCERCQGSGDADTGGVTPWGEGISGECPDCFKKRGGV